METFLVDVFVVVLDVVAASAVIVKSPRHNTAVRSKMADFANFFIKIPPLDSNTADMGISNPERLCTILFPYKTDADKNVCVYFCRVASHVREIKNRL